LSLPDRHVTERADGLSARVIRALVRGCVMTDVLPKVHRRKPRLRSSLGKAARFLEIGETLECARHGLCKRSFSPTEHLRQQHTSRVTFGEACGETCCPRQQGDHTTPQTAGFPPHSHSLEGHHSCSLHC
jgi:hypothetical protein